MLATSLLQTLLDTGITLEVAGDHLAAHPASRLTDKLRAAIRQHKDALLAELRADADQETTTEHATIHEPDSVAELFCEFYGHLMGPAKAKNCCYAPNDRYCEEGQRLHDAYQAACREGGGL